jgi:glucose-1-phosphate adenylyltransferase
MELLVENPGLDLYDEAWPMWTYQGQFPPPICVGAGTVSKSIVTAGCRIQGAVEHSVLSRNCAIGPGSKVESTIVLPNASIGRNCRITRAIVESGCEIPDGVKFVHPHDPGTGLFAVSRGGVALLTQDALARVLKRKSQDAAANVTYLASGRKTHNGLPPS